MKRVILATLAAFAAVLSFMLWPAWRYNPDVSHGLFMPVVFIFLIHHSRTAGPRRYLPSGAGVLAATSALALAGLGLLFLGGLYAAAVDWSNALVGFLLAASLSCLLLAALVSFADERVRWIPFNWTALVAAGLWPLSAPIPPGTYTRLTVGLQLWVSSGVLHALHLLGVVAFRQGNIIQLSTASVGVEEACSGVRSLVSCVFVGIFFSACLVSRPWARALIIALAAPLALGMNFFRSLMLTLLANSGVDIAGTWHDATGFAVLGLTAVLLASLALLLERGVAKEKGSAGASPGGVPRSTGRSRVLAGNLDDGRQDPSPARPMRDSAAASACATFSSQRVLAVVLALASALIVLFYVNTHPGVRRDAPVPDLWTMMPESQPGWTVTTIDYLNDFRDVLQTDVLAQRTYTRDGPDGQLQVTLYAAYWRPGQASVSLVATHAPDACWPGAGWVLQPLPQSQEAVAAGGRNLATAEYRLFTSPHTPQYVWFWHLYDGQPIAYINPYSLGRLLHIAWLYGFRHDGDQMFVRVSSNRPWAEFAKEAFLQQFFTRLQPLGL